jgi:RNA polymerase sigma factor (sigma-70 family)
MRDLKRWMLAELEDAIDDLPADQREVFIAHEIEGRSFKELAAATGVNINTLLARKRYAVARLRRRLESIYREFGGAARVPKDLEK